MASEQEEPPLRVQFSDEVEDYWRRFKKSYYESRFIIENRWLSLTKEQRIDVLGKVWKDSGDSEMPKDHRPDLVGLVPWRSDLESNRQLLPLKTGLNESHLRWPGFNQHDLTERKDTFLVLLEARAREHPMEFAFLDHFRENRPIAINEGLVEGAKFTEYKPGMNFAAITTIDPDSNAYGLIYSPEDLFQAYALSKSAAWPELASKQLMVNQRRIYRFLEGVVTRITTRPELYKVVGEDKDPDWQLPVPVEEELEQGEFDAARDAYVEFLRDTMDYTAISDDLLNLVRGISSQQMDFYEAQLQGLKSNPRLFYEWICDIREHSHHQLLYADNNARHAWADYEQNMDNTQMFAMYLIGAVLALTEGFDFWSYALRACYEFTDVREKNPNGDTPEFFAALLYLYNLFRERMRFSELWVTLGCSQPLRKQFVNTKPDHVQAEVACVFDPNMPASQSRVSKLFSLLRNQVSEGVENVIPFEGDTWADEILTLIRDSPQWPSTFAARMVEETYDASCALKVIRRMWDYYNVNRSYEIDDTPGWKDYQKWSDKLRNIDLASEAFTDIVSRHMVPSPNLKFEYPEINQYSRLKKRRENATKRRVSESNLAALWADLQPFLVEQNALSELSIGALDHAIPLATARDGRDITPQPAPPAAEPPQTPPTAERPRPSTPIEAAGPGGSTTPTGVPGPSGPELTTTPTGPLQGLSINSPSRRPPAARTPERKTADDGVKKTSPIRPSPIRPARPDEERPRRFNVNRRRARVEQMEHMAREINIVVPARPAPDDPPAPGPVRPKIELSSDSYELLSDLMTTDQNKRAGKVSWNDILKIFIEIGFSTERNGRKSRGGLQTFTPSEALKEAQGIQKIISKDRPHGPYMPFTTAREWLVGPHGFGKYGWDFDERFKEAGAPDEP